MQKVKNDFMTEKFHKTPLVAYQSKAQSSAKMITLLNERGEAPISSELELFRGRTGGWIPSCLPVHVLTIKLISLVISSDYSRPAGRRILDYYKFHDYRPEGVIVALLADRRHYGRLYDR